MLKDILLFRLLIADSLRESGNNHNGNNDPSGCSVAISGIIMVVFIIYVLCGGCN